MPGTINTPLFDKACTKLGVKPVGLPPIYEPGVVTDVILYAAEHPARDLVAGGAAQAMILNQRLSPRLVAAILATRVGFEPQKTEEPKSEGYALHGSSCMLRLHGRPALPTVDRVQKKAMFMQAKPVLRKTVNSVSPGSSW
jgi:hypothetical protein